MPAPTPIADLQANIASIIEAVAKGVSEGGELAGCDVQILSEGTKLQINGQVSFGGEIIESISESDNNEEHTLSKLPEEIQQSSSRVYGQEVTESATASGAVGVDLSIQSTINQ